MESTSNNPRIEKLQQIKEQLIQRSKQADSPEESHFFLCEADLYSLAMQHEDATVFGSSLNIKVGSDDDAVSRVTVEVRTDFKSRTNHFEVSFGMWKALTSKITQGVSEKHFQSAEDAFNYIVGLSENINRFFNAIKL